jgi:hypothetical protein
MLMPAPSAAARPTTSVVCGLWVAKAVAKSGASVETEPSISPANAGWTTRSKKACSSCSAGTSPIRRAMSHNSARLQKESGPWPSRRRVAGRSRTGVRIGEPPAVA